MAVSIEPIPAVLPGYRTETVFVPLCYVLRLPFQKVINQSRQKRKIIATH